MTFSVDKEFISKNKTTEIEETEASCHIKKKLSQGLYLLPYKLLKSQIIIIKIKHVDWKADMSGQASFHVFYTY